MWIPFSLFSQERDLYKIEVALTQVDLTQSFVMLSISRMKKHVNNDEGKINSIFFGKKYDIDLYGVRRVASGLLVLLIIIVIIIIS